MILDCQLGAHLNLNTQNVSSNPTHDIPLPLLGKSQLLCTPSLLAVALVQPRVLRILYGAEKDAHQAAQRIHHRDTESMAWHLKQRCQRNAMAFKSSQNVNLAGGVRGRHGHTPWSDQARVPAAALSASTNQPLISSQCMPVCPSQALCMHTQRVTSLYCHKPTWRAASASRSGLTCTATKTDRAGCKMLCQIVRPFLASLLAALSGTCNWMSVIIGAHPQVVCDAACRKHIQCLAS